MQRSTTYVVRAWLEPTPDGAGSWRASASDVLTKERWHFADPAELAAFLGDARAAGPRTAGTGATPRLVVTGTWLVIAAVTFWLAWALMPDAATNDAQRIHQVVRQHGPRVLTSVAIQLFSCAAFVPGLLGFLPPSTDRGRRFLAWGVGLLLVGALGMGADAIFHLAAYAMAVRGGDASEVMPSLIWMQTAGLAFLVPLLLPFFVGAILLPLGLHRAGILSRHPVTLACAAPAALVLGSVLARAGLVERHGVVLAFLALVALALTWTGFAAIRRSSRAGRHP